MLAKPEYSSPPIRFVAGRGAVAKLLQAGDRRHRGLPAGTLQRRAIGKMLLAGSAMAELLAGSAIAKRMAALWQRAIGKMLPAGAPWRSCWQGAPQWQRCCRQGRCRRPWEAGTATSSGKASNLPEGMHHREDAAGMGAAAKSHREDVAGRGAAAKSHREAGRERAPAAGKERALRAASEQKRERQNPLSLKPALVMTALVRVTGARPRGSSQLLLCSLELLW